MAPKCIYCGERLSMEHGVEGACVERVIKRNFQQYLINGEWKVFGPEITGAETRMAAMWEVEVMG